MLVAPATAADRRRAERGLKRLFGPRAVKAQALPPSDSTFAQLQRELAERGVSAQRLKRPGGGYRIVLSDRTGDWCFAPSVRRASLIAQAWLASRDRSWLCARDQVVVAQRAARNASGAPA